MKSANKLIFGAFTLFFLIAIFTTMPSVSAGSEVINTFLVYEDSASATSKTVTQGDLFNVVMVAYGHGEPLQHEKLELVSSSLIFQEYASGDKIATYTWLYSKTYTVNTGILVPGIYTLRFTAKTATTQSVEYFDLQLIILPKPDTTKPVVIITDPQPGTYTSHRTILSFDVRDDNLESCTYKLNNDPERVLSPIFNGIHALVGISSIEGVNTWTVTCTDKSGNVGIDSVTFNVVLPPKPDTTKPVVNITDPKSGTYNAHKTSLTFNVYDENLQSCTYKLNNNPAINIPSIVNGVKILTGIGSVEGVNTWTVTCTDKSGNTGTDSVTFTVVLPKPDTTKPVVNITDPKSGTYTSHRTVLNFEAYDDDLQSCSYKLNNDPERVLSPIFNGIHALVGISSVEGTNTWTVTCTDKSGNIGTDSVTFTVVLPPKPDTTKPVVNITDPKSGTYNAHKTSLTFNVYDENLQSCTYKLNNNPAINIPSIANGVKTITGISSVEGTNTWTVTCTDKSGNVGTDSVTFTVVLPPKPDTTKPVVTITDPKSGTYNAHKTSLTFNVYDENLQSCTYKLNNNPVINIPSIVNGVKTITGISSVEGINTWTVTCTDKSGNVGTDSVTFTVVLPKPDTTKPVVNITDPKSGTYNAHKTSLTFSVYDDNLQSCTYKLNNNPVVNIPSIANGVKTITGISSVEGTNTWTVTCTDKSGNVGTDSVTFTVVLPKPEENCTVCKDSKPLDDSDFIPVTGKTNIVYEDDDSNISIDKRQDASNKNGLLLAILTLVLALLILWVLVVIVRFVRR